MKAEILMNHGLIHLVKQNSYSGIAIKIVDLSMTLVTQTCRKQMTCLLRLRLTKYSLGLIGSSSLFSWIHWFHTKFGKSFKDESSGSFVRYISIIFLKTQHLFILFFS